MKLSDFDYILPKELVAQYPSDERDKCRLMVLNRATRQVEHRAFGDIVSYFHSGDCLVLNNTKVMPARLYGKRVTGGKVEIFLLNLPKTDEAVEALVKPSGRIKEGERILLESGDVVEVLGQGELGRLVRFSRDLGAIIEESGHVPLPPYIDRPDEPSDRHDYQTVYAGRVGATASPTAGLHFTKDLLKIIEGCGVKIAYVTLHTNYGTFAPVKSEMVEDHKMHKEYFDLPQETAKVISETKKSGGRVFAVGTTSTRVLESCAGRSETGRTDLFIYPGYKFKIVDHLITNFHIPKSTLLLLVSAFAGREFVLDAYRQAIEERYRFFSYGDAMLIV